MILTNEFVVLKDKKICKFNKYSDIPESFEQISFKPDYPALQLDKNTNT